MHIKRAELYTGTHTGPRTGCTLETKQIVFDTFHTRRLCRLFAIDTVSLCAVYRIIAEREQHTQETGYSSFPVYVFLYSYSTRTM